MLITRLGGIPAKADVVDTAGSAIVASEKIEALFIADAAITVGHVVMLDTGHTDGAHVVTGTAANEHRAAGIYAGKGGTGTATSTANLTGNAAAASDVIFVTIYGKETALMDGGTTDIVDGEGMDVGGTDGELDGEGAYSGTGEIAPFVALTAITTASTAGEVFVRCM